MRDDKQVWLPHVKVPVGRAGWTHKPRPKHQRRRFLTRVAWTLGLSAVLLGAVGGWLGMKAVHIRAHLQSAEALVPALTNEMLVQDRSEASATIDEIIKHTDEARAAANDPIWILAGALPLVGDNFSAIREITLGASEVARGTAKPLVNVVSVIDWEGLTPSNGKLDLTALESSSPAIVSAANTLDLTFLRLKALDSRNLLPEVAKPLTDATEKLGEFRSELRTAADVARVLPSMMGSTEPRSYLVLIQNSAEVRAAGGLPGSLALIRVDDGSIDLVSQKPGSALGKFTPPVQVAEAQSQIYSSRLGAFIGDVNLTPDFPTTAKAAKKMWETRYGGPVDGVLAIDPVVLANILEASGPIHLSGSEVEMASVGLPNALSSENVVRTLLSDVYLNLETNEAQDTYFSGAARAIFRSLTSGEIPGPALLQALSLSYGENRLRLWSDHQEDQRILSTTALGGAVSGPHVGGAAFGIYLNDGTGAKMDYYMRRTVQLVEVCTDSEYAEYRVKIKTTNTAPVNASSVLPTSVTGDGRFGTPPGLVRTNVVVYGPAMSNVDEAFQNGKKTSFGSHVDGNRPVGVVTTLVAPGATTEVEVSFIKVVQVADPAIVVTPTVQKVEDVILPTQRATCEGF